jgi:hypothetical protein
MDTAYYLDTFKKSAGQLDKQRLHQTGVECKVGVWLQSVALKMQKQSWLNKAATAKPFGESIFFSIWLNDELIGKNRLNYNIHALQLRQLTGYTIKSRDFAAAFRSRFKPFEKKWPNASVDFGPLTLMEGWITLNAGNIEKEIVTLAHQFLEIQFIIDDLLAERKKEYITSTNFN